MTDFGLKSAIGIKQRMRLKTSCVMGDCIACNNYFLPFLPFLVFLPVDVFLLEAEVVAGLPALM